MQSFLEIFNFFYQKRPYWISISLYFFYWKRFFMLVNLWFFDFNFTKFYNFFYFYICLQKFIYFWKLKFLVFSYVSGSNFESSKNFLHFRKWNIFTSCLKKSCFVFRTTLKVFHFFTFSFLLAFTSFCFHFFMFSFLQMFLMLLAFVHFTAFSLFVRYLVFVLLYHECYGFERVPFILRWFLPYTPSYFY